MPSPPERFCPQKRQDARASAIFRPPWRGWYALARWSSLRESQLSAEPLCRHCAAAGRTTPATDVDHVTPHRGDPALFWDSRNLQSLCKACHSRKTQAGQ